MFTDLPLRMAGSRLKPCALQGDRSVQRIECILPRLELSLLRGCGKKMSSKERSCFFCYAPLGDIVPSEPTSPAPSDALATAAPTRLHAPASSFRAGRLRPMQ